MVEQEARDQTRRCRALPDSVATVTRRGLCMGCGTCQSVCPSGAVVMQVEARTGCITPRIDDQRCTHCGRCMAICPGHSPSPRRAPQEPGSARWDDVIGAYHACYTGHAASHDVRYHGASGGIATALLVHMLQSGAIDGALVTQMSPSNPLQTTWVLARSVEEIVAANGSKYCPTAPNAGLSEILAHEGHYAVVGLPCHMHAIRRWGQSNPLLAERIALHLGLFCANNNTYLGTEYFLWQHGIAPQDVAGIRYRAEGWPGRIVVTLRDGRRIVVPRGSSERRWHRRALFTSAFHYHFAIPRCLLCADQTCEAADLSLGDPWLRELTVTERVGLSLVIARNPQGEALLSDAVAAGAIVVQPTDISVVRRAQNYAFKRDVGGRIWLCRTLGRAVPEYPDRALPASIRSVLSGLRYLPCYVSHHRRLWPLLRVLAVVEGESRLLMARIGRGMRRLFGASPKDRRAV
jgi:coenzyme F420 hydrogenase subunit beta